jgi:hypothetical protein
MAASHVRKELDGETGVGLAPEEQSRAETYLLLAHLLHAPPAARLLDALGALEGDPSELGLARAALARAARATAPPEVATSWSTRASRAPRPMPPSTSSRARAPTWR